MSIRFVRISIRLWPGRFCCYIRTMNDLPKKVADNIEAINLLEPGMKILVAFSGGPDSTALLDILFRLRNKLKVTLEAVYINHNLRPRETPAEIEFCHDFCRERRLPFTIVTADIAAFARETGRSLEDAGRQFRLGLLTRTARQDSFDRVALGHHLDDTIETVIYRLLRGTGPGGFRPIRPLFGPFIRPLFNIPRSEIEDYLKKRKIPFMTDRSNRDISFDRNYIRHELLPLVEGRFGPGYRRTIFNFARIISEEDSYLGGLTERAYKKVARLSPGGKIIVDLNRISSYALWLKRRLIRRMIEQLSGHPGAGNFDEVERVNLIIEGELKATGLVGKIHVTRDKQRLFLYREKLRLPATEIPIPGTVDLTPANLYLRVGRRDRSAAILKSQKGGRKIHIDEKKTRPPLFVRGIKSGDRFTPLGMTGTKKIGDYLTDRKVALPLRDEIPLVCDRDGIIWLAGHEIADRVKIDRKTDRVLEIELIQRQKNRFQRI